MAIVVRILQRCLVVEFYKQNAAFFGLILLVFFGFIKSSEHLAIGSFLVANPSTLWFLYVIFLAYLLKVFLFIRPTIYKTENQFLALFYELPIGIKVGAVMLTAFSLLIPVTTYAAFLIIIAIQAHFYLSIVSLLLAVCVLASIVSIIIFRQLNLLPHEKTFHQLAFLRKSIKPPFSFFVEFMLRNEIVLLILSKIYVCGLLIGTSMLYKTDDFDLRLLTTGVLLACVGNVAIVQKYVWFQHFQLAHFKNLPHSFSTIVIRQSATFLFLMIPEFLVLFRHYPLRPSLLDVSGILLFGFSLLTIIYAFQLRKQVELSDFMTVLFWLVVLSTFMILFSLHPLALGIMYLVISFEIIRKRYDQFEYVDS